MIFGFTGTRNGMTSEQRTAVNRFLKGYIHGVIEGVARREDDTEQITGVHGDCIGADVDFDAICKTLWIPTKIRPCTFANMRANCDAEELAEPKAPMARNRDIVADADIMIACPPNKERIKSGSGTWATIGFAEKANKPIYIAYPDGDIDFSLGDGVFAATSKPFTDEEAQALWESLPRAELCPEQE